jgi:hypothetical protein
MESFLRESWYAEHFEEETSAELSPTTPQLRVEEKEEGNSNCEN